MTIDQSFLTAASAIVGAALSQILGHVFKKDQRQFDELKDLRRELREQILNLKKENDDLRVSLEGWRGKYYKLADENSELNMNCRELGIQIEELLTKYVPDKTRADLLE